MKDETKAEYKNLSFRKTVVPRDTMTVTDIIKSIGHFKSHDIEAATMLVEDRLKNGDGCGYQFCFLEVEGRTIGFGCYGEIPRTVKNYDLYWLAVHNDFRGKGFGRMLLEKIEADIKKRSGRGIYAESSNKEHCAQTIEFYKANGYLQISVYTDYYDIQDDKVTFFKKL